MIGISFLRSCAHLGKKILIHLIAAEWPTSGVFAFLFNTFQVGVRVHSPMESLDDSQDSFPQLQSVHTSPLTGRCYILF
jgi:hypothetical protein